jgi:hypothetical protein
MRRIFLGLAVVFALALCTAPAMAGGFRRDCAPPPVVVQPYCAPAPIVVPARHVVYHRDVRKTVIIRHDRGRVVRHVRRR